MSSESNDTNGQRIARLVRLAADAELPVEIQRELAAELLGELGTDFTAGASGISTSRNLPHGIPGAVIRPQTLASQRATPVDDKREHAFAKPNEAAERVGATHQASAHPSASAWNEPHLGPPGPSASFRLKAAQLKLRIRQLVEADAPWEQLESVALNLLAAKGDQDTAARILELAVLRAPTDRIERIVQILNAQVTGFYPAIHPMVRSHLAARLYREHSDVLAPTLIGARDESYLQPGERLVAFCLMADGDDAAGTYIYFRKWQSEILQAASEFGQSVGRSLGGILLLAGRLAAELGNDEEARIILAYIPENTPERGEALKSLLKPSKAGTRSVKYRELLLAEASPKRRINLLSQFFATTRGLGGFKDQCRGELNELLQDPWPWVEQDQEALAAYSDLMIANRDLIDLLPALFDGFRTAAGRFLHPKLDLPFWQGPMRLSDDSAASRYWRGVALLHQYAGSGVETHLWEARELITRSRKGPFAPPLNWSDLHKALFSWVQKSPYLLEVDRARMLRQLRVAHEVDAVCIMDLEDYVSHADSPPYAVLRALEAVADVKGAPVLEARLILCRAHLSHLTNQDLARLWHLATVRDDADLAWRIATVLQARGALSPKVRHAWEISGENRKQYPFQVPPKNVVEKCLRGLPPKAARLAFASLHLGAALPALLAALDPGSASAKIPQATQGSVEAQVDHALQEISWLAVPRRRFRFSGEHPQATDLPGFMQLLPANPWSLLVGRLCERLGVNAWGWKLSRLNLQIEGLIPRLAVRQDLQRHSAKVAKWLRDLSPEQRAAWQDLISLSRSLDDQEATFGLATFVCRLALVLLPHHLQALTSLQAMRAPVRILWDIESWLIGEAYSDLRESFGLKSRVLVPGTLKRASQRDILI